MDFTPFHRLIATEKSTDSLINQLFDYRNSKNPFFIIYSKHPKLFPINLKKAVRFFLHLFYLHRGGYLQEITNELRTFAPNDFKALCSYYYSSTNDLTEVLPAIRDLRLKRSDLFAMHKVKFVKDTDEFSDLRSASLQVNVNLRAGPIRKMSHDVEKEGGKRKSKVTNARLAGRKVEYYCGEVDTFNLTYCGFGTLTKTIGVKQIYAQGYFKNSQQCGPGLIHQRSTTENLFYFGEFLDDVFNGNGEFYQILRLDKKTEILLFEGQFERGFFKKGRYIKMIEIGKEVSVISYEGSFNQVGIFDDLNAKYEEKLIKRVKGKEVIPIRNLTYFGAFKNGKRNGSGKTTIKDSNLPYFMNYKGSFKDSNFHGSGEITFTGVYNISSYKGIFEEGQWCRKYGIVNFTNGDIYEGFFGNSGLKDCIGIYKYFDLKQRKHKEFYFGGFFVDTKYGKGVYFDKAGKFMVGQYVGGMKEGYFELIDNAYNAEARTRASSVISGKEGVEKKSKFERSDKEKTLLYFVDDEFVDKEKIINVYFKN